MKTRVRQVIAVTLLATALASDRALAVAASSKIERTPEHRNLVTKLTQHLRRAVAGVKIQLVRIEQFESVDPTSRVLVLRTPNFRSGLLSVFQLYLPPPIL